MAFKFSLAAVLKFRAMIEEREERLLHQIALQVSQARDELELTGQKILAAYASLGQESEGAATGYTVQAAYGEVKYLTEARKELELRIEKLEELRDKQRRIYEVARRNREVLSKLREEKHFAWATEMRKREQSMLDDNFNARRRRT